VRSDGDETEDVRICSFFGGASDCVSLVMHAQEDPRRTTRSKGKKAAVNNKKAVTTKKKKKKKSIADKESTCEDGPLKFDLVKGFAARQLRICWRLPHTHECDKTKQFLCIFCGFVGRIVAGGGINSAVVGRRGKDRGFHDRRPETGAGFLLTVCNDYGRNITLLRSAELLAMLKTALKTSGLDHLAVAECVLFEFFFCFSTFFLCFCRDMAVLGGSVLSALPRFPCMPAEVLMALVRALASETMQDKFTWSVTLNEEAVKKENAGKKKGEKKKTKKRKPTKTKKKSKGAEGVESDAEDDEEQEADTERELDTKHGFFDVRWMKSKLSARVRRFTCNCLRGNSSFGRSVMGALSSLGVAEDALAKLEYQGDLLAACQVLSLVLLFITES